VAGEEGTVMNHSTVTHLRRKPHGRTACGHIMRPSYARTDDPAKVTCKRCNETLYLRLQFREGDLVQLRPFEDQPRENCRLAGPCEKGGMYIGFIEPKPSGNDDGLREFHAGQIEKLLKVNPEKERVTP
jgi:hypothetical protein